MAKRQSKTKDIRSANKGPNRQTVNASLTMQSVHAGPIPAPYTLEAYGKVIQGLEVTIIEEWKAETASRRHLEDKELDIRSKAVKSHGRRETWKVIVIGIYIIGAMALAGFLAYKGQYTLAAGIVVSPIILSIIDRLLSK